MFVYVPRSRQGSAWCLCCPSRWSLRFLGPSSVQPGPCTVGSLHSCTASVSSGIRFPPSAVPVSGTQGNHDGYGNCVRGDGEGNRRTANYSDAGTFDGSRQTAQFG